MEETIQALSDSKLEDTHTHTHKIAGGQGKS